MSMAPRPLPPHLIGKKPPPTPPPPPKAKREPDIIIKIIVERGC